MGERNGETRMRERSEKESGKGFFFIFNVIFSVLFCLWCLL